MQLGLRKNGIATSCDTSTVKLCCKAGTSDSWWSSGEQIHPDSGWSNERKSQCPSVLVTHSLHWKGFFSLSLCYFPSYRIVPETQTQTPMCRNPVLISQSKQVFPVNCSDGAARSQMRLSRLLLYQIHMHAPASRGQLHSSTQVRIHQKVWFFRLRLSFPSFSFALLTLLTFAFPESAGEQGKLAAPSREDIIWYLIKLGDAGNLEHLFQHVATRFNRFLTSAYSPMWPLYTHYLVLRLSQCWFDSEKYLLSRLPGRYSLYIMKK